MSRSQTFRGGVSKQQPAISERKGVRPGSEVELRPTAPLVGQAGIEGRWA